MGDSDYSFSLTTFSPSGKLVQIEYALNAVNAGSTSLGIKGAARLLTRERGGAQGRPHGRGKGRGAANATASPLGSGAGWSFMGLRVPRLLHARQRAPHLLGAPQGLLHHHAVVIVNEPGGGQRAACSLSWPLVSCRRQCRAIGCSPGVQYGGPGHMERPKE